MLEQSATMFHVAVAQRPNSSFMFEGNMYISSFQVESSSLSEITLKVLFASELKQRKTSSLKSHPTLLFKPKPGLEDQS